MSLWKVAGALHKPNGMTVNSYSPEWVHLHLPIASGEVQGRKVFTVGQQSERIVDLWQWKHVHLRDGI